MRKITSLLIIGLLLTATTAMATSYQYLSPADTKDMLVQQQPMTLVDIQVEDEFTQHHLPGALATYAYPVKSAADRAKLEAILSQLQGDDAVVIVCPRGGGGAKRAYDYLLEEGVAEKRLFILENGQQGWPYPEHLAEN